MSQIVGNISSPQALKHVVKLGLYSSTLRQIKQVQNNNKFQNIIT